MPGNAEYKLAWARANVEKCRAATRRSYLKNREKKLARERAYYKAHPEKRKEALRKCMAKPESQAKKKAAHKRWSLKVAYGLTPDDVRRMAERQHGRCLICTRNDRELVVDHDHKTGAVRGLLCRHCNLMIGYAADNPVLLERASAYLVPFGKMTPMEAA